MKNSIKTETEAFYAGKSLPSEEEMQNRVIEQAMAILEGRLKKFGHAYTSIDDAKKYLCLQLGNLEHEIFGVMFLNNQHRLIEYQELFRGTIAECSVYPREVVKEAIRLNAAAVIFSHNHPSGLTDPSQADYAITRKLKDALALIDIKTLDHIIVAGNRARSFAEFGEI
ncbi:MAG: DNA repair protein RadC [Methylomicrobium sp.]|nr:DNA repair protein RadC [Methylomicrobium sp.]